MVQGKGPGFVLAAAICLMVLAPAPAAAAGVQIPAAGRDTVSGGVRPGAATFQGSADTRRRSLPALPRPATQPAAGTAPAAARRIGLAAGIGTNVQVTTQPSSTTAVAVDPNDATGRTLSVSADSRTSSGLPVFTSTDAGATWAATSLAGRNDPLQVDPGVAYALSPTTIGNPWFSFLGVDNAGQTEVLVEHEESRGTHSVVAVDTPIDEPDKPMLAIDQGLNDIYVGFDQNPSDIKRQPIAVATSTIEGVSFGAPVQVWDSGGDFGAWPAVAGDGTVYVVWDDYCGGTPTTVDTQSSCPKPNGQILVSKSTDHGATWSATPTTISATTTGFGSIVPNHSTECTQGCPARVVNPSPQIAIDRSGGARSGTIYVVYSDGADPQMGASTVPSTHRMHVFLQESKDGGATWSGRLNLDADNPNDAWQPSVAVDQSNGNVVVSWYGRRDDGNNVLYLPYFTESTADNGGAAAFVSAVPVADVPSDPRIDCGGSGDYLQLAAAAGTAHVVWTDTRTGGPTIFTAAIDEAAAATPAPTPAPGGGPSGTARPPTGTGWLGRPGGATDIGVGASCRAWIIGLNAIQGGGQTWFFDGVSWQPFAGGGVRITVHPAGEPRLVNASGQVWRLQPSGWQQLPGAGTDIASGPDASLWLIGIDNITGGHGVYFFNGSGFTFANGGGVRIAVGPDGLPWIVNSSRAIWHLTPGGWVNVPGAAVDIGVGADGSVWVLGQNSITGGFQTYHYNGHGWDAVNGGGVAITVGPDGMPWVVNDRGQIFERV
jgi:hypothetical protein